MGRGRIAGREAVTITFEVSGADLPQIEARARRELAEVLGPIGDEEHRRVAMRIDVSPEASTGDGEILRWAGEVRATIEPEPTF